MIKKLEPYSENIIFFDTEFSSNDISTGELMSIGMVKVTGEELYFELKHSGPISSWVKKHILLTLTGIKVSKNTAVEKIRKFVGKDKPYLISYRTPYDTVYLHKLFGNKNLDNLPFYPWPVDFDTLLFMLGYDPRSMGGEKLKKIFSKELDIDVAKYKLHNALDDARILRDVYLKLVRR